MLREGKETLIVLDFAGLDRRFSLGPTRWWPKSFLGCGANEYGEKFLVLKGLSPSQAENIGVALERKSWLS